MSDSERRGRLEGLLTLLKMNRDVGLFHIEEKSGELFLHVNRDLFQGDLAKHIAEMSDGDIEADQIDVRTIGQRR